MLVTQNAASNINVGVLQLIRTWKWQIMARHWLPECTFESMEKSPGLNKLPWTLGLVRRS